MCSNYLYLLTSLALYFTGIGSVALDRWLTGIAEIWIQDHKILTEPNKNGEPKLSEFVAGVISIVGQDSRDRNLAVLK